MGRHSGQTVGYIRVGAADQNPARQLEATGDVDRLFSEAASGGSADRSPLREMLGYVREGDVVRVKSSDCLSRSTADLLKSVEARKTKGVALEFVVFVRDKPFKDRCLLCKVGPPSHH